MDDELSTDQAASLRAIIVQERATVAWYTHLLTVTEPGAIETRLKALRKYHQAQIKRRTAELKR
jgi:hypothetical protein